jgi:hypothetical protein
MSKSITVSLSDTDYEALQAASAHAHQSVEELAAVALSLMARPSHAATRSPMTLEEAQQAKERVLAVMRARGHLAEPAPMPLPPIAETLPPAGTTERARLEEEAGDDLSDALEESGKTILDLIER